MSESGPEKRLKFFGLSDYGRDFAAVHVLTQLPVDVLRLDPELLDATASANSTSPTLIALVRKAHQLLKMGYRSVVYTGFPDNPSVSSLPSAFLPYDGLPRSLVMKDRMEVSPLARGVMLV